jgi:hypothetical protein
MPLTAGERLGPYEIISQIGAGGMGEVYLAKDTRLGREVAIKTSNQQFTERFEREARAIASLNHPNICGLFDVGPNFLVMEYVEGEAPKGPLPLEEALRIARQISDALSEAHEKGITHRDLKRQHQDQARRHSEGAGFRTREDIRAEGRRVGSGGHPIPHTQHGRDSSRHDPWYRGLHGSRAGQGQARRPPRRYLGVRGRSA